MIKEALQYIARLAQDSQEIVTKEIDGDIYTKGDAKRIEFDKVRSVELNQLRSVVDYVRDCLNHCDFKVPFIVNVSHNEVIVSSALDSRLDRNYLCIAKPLLPRIIFNQFMDMESFVIQLKTCFEDTENLNRLVSIVSSITDESTVSMQDDGFGLTVSQISGTTIKSKENLQINPIVRLAPYRTFAEVEQPQSRFLLRVRDGGQMALHEADGGMWKLEAQDNISLYLRNALSKEITEGTVVVVG